MEVIMQEVANKPMTVQKYYMAFLSSDELYTKAKLYIAALQGDGANDLASRRTELIDILLLFTDESLQAQFLNYLDLMTVNSVVRKAVTGCVTTIKKASSPLVKKLVNSMTVKELTILANYMEKVIVGNSDTQAYVGYPITKDIVNGFNDSFERVRAGRGPENVGLLQDNLVEMTRCAYYTFFEEPMAELELNRVKRKLADVAVKVCKTATLSLIGSVFKGMGQPELEAVSDYLEGMIYDREEPA